MGFSSESKKQTKRKYGPLLAKWRKVRYNASNYESKGADTVNFAQCFAEQPYLLMEGALGERLKREYGLRFDEHVAMAQLMRAAEGRVALRALWLEYAQTAAQYGLPFMATRVSPAFIPAFAAGERGVTDSILTGMFIILSLT